MNLEKGIFDAFAARAHPKTTEVLRAEVQYDGERIRELLAARTSTEISVDELRTVVEGNLWMLAPATFLYFLPAFMNACMTSYRPLSVFASELIGALTRPTREDVTDAIDRIEQLPQGLGLPKETTELLRRQQLELHDSGTPLAIFHARFDDLVASEGAAVLSFLDAFRAAYGADFPFDELEVAIDRHWRQYRTP